MDNQIEQRFENTSKSATFHNIVEIFGLNKKSVLDIGCSYGEFLVHFGKGSTGITIVKDEAMYGAGKGLDIKCGNIESGDFSLREKYDAIFANNIFEHLYSPHNFLRRAKEFVKPNGILILGVPCIPKVTSLIHLNKFKGSLATAHINFFTKDTLAKTVEKGGWKLIMVRGFRFKNKIFDHLLDSIYPHFYAVATPNPDFKYSEKRMKELAGYVDVKM